jgi:hypothetical protein
MFGGQKNKALPDELKTNFLVLLPPICLAMPCFFLLHTEKEEKRQ